MDVIPYTTNNIGSLPQPHQSTQISHLKSEVISELLGHSHGSITLDRYGKAYTLETLKDVVDILEYPVPLEELKVVGGIYTKNI